MTWAMHVANVFFLVSYAVKDLLWLRLLMVFASVVTVGALLHSDPVPADLMTWQLVFFAINLARLVQLWHERRPVALPPHARTLAASTFRGLAPRALVRLLAVGETIDLVPGDRVVRSGEALTHLAIVVDGTARVELAERPVELAHGALIGELAYLTGKPPAADVVAATALRVVRWPADDLRAHLAANPDTRAAMQHVIGADLATKLRGRT